MIEIMIVKLVNGDEVIGRVDSSLHTPVLTSRDPLLLEHRSLKDGATTIILSTYSPHKSSDQISIQPNQWIWRVAANEDMIAYYEASLIYNKKSFDKTLSDAVREATTFMRAIVKEIEEIGEPRMVNLADISPGSSANN